MHQILSSFSVLQTTNAGKETRLMEELFMVQCTIGKLYCVAE